VLEHLVQFEPEITEREDFLKLDDASPADLLSAQVATASWLEELGVAPDEVVSKEAQTIAARESFKVVVQSADNHTQREKLVTIKTPEAVRHLTGMLAAYDWEFVQQAKEIRGYAVAQLLEETKSPNANIRLKALGLLGKVTEVGLFTEQIEIKKEALSDDEIDQKIKDKLNRFMGVTDAALIEDIEVTPPADEAQRPDALPN